MKNVKAVLKTINGDKKKRNQIIAGAVVGTMVAGVLIKRVKKALKDKEIENQVNEIVNECAEVEEDMKIVGDDGKETTFEDKYNINVSQPQGINEFKEKLNNKLSKIVGE